jgi:DNA-binding transcriptional ArsR family regulator
VPQAAVKPARARRRAPTRQLFDLVAEHFRVMGEPARLELLHALQTGERSAASLLAEVRMSQANLSKQMAVLCAAGFVHRRRDGAFVHYRLADERVLALCELMCDHLDADAAHVRALTATRR